LAGNEKKNTVGKTTDHEKKITHQNEVLPGKIELKKQKNDGAEMVSNDNELLKKYTISCGPWNNKREGNASQRS
jgi:hypothetical protein